MTIKDLEIIKGDNRTYTLNFTNASGKIDITGWKATMIIKKTVASPKYILKKEITAHTDPAQGKSTIPLSAAETGQIPAGKYVYSITTTTAIGEVFTVLAGTYKVKAF